MKTSGKHFGLSVGP